MTRGLFKIGNGGANAYGNPIDVTPNCRSVLYTPEPASQAASNAASLILEFQNSVTERYGMRVSNVIPPNSC